MTTVLALRPKHTTPTTRRSLYAAFTHAKYLLGQMMYEEGLDDGTLCSQIGAAEREMRRAEKEGRPTEGLRVNRNRLLVLLAEAALEFDAPLPGADEEYEAVRRAEASLKQFDERAAVTAEG
jgi:hypothetical protein